MKHTKRGRESANAKVDPPAALEQAPRPAPAPAMTLHELRKLAAEAEKNTPGDLEAKSRASRGIFAGAFVTPTDLEELRFLAVCQRLRREWRGCNTPFEEFFHGVVFAAAHFAPTPESVLEDVEEFRENWRDFLSDAHAFYLDHPDLLVSGEVACNAS